MDPGALDPAGGLRVLVADDDPALRKALVGLVEDEGFTVVAEVADGASAVREAIAQRPDVALIDLRMPELDGIQAAHAISEAAPGVRVVVLSAYDDDSLRSAAVAAGAASYLVKGCSAQDILDALMGLTSPG